MQPPAMMLLEDATDLADFLEAPGRMIPRARWVDAYVEAARQSQAKATIEGFIG